MPTENGGQITGTVRFGQSPMEQTLVLDGSPGIGNWEAADTAPADGFFHPEAR